MMPRVKVIAILIALISPNIFANPLPGRTPFNGSKNYCQVAAYIEPKVAGTGDRKQIR